MFKIYIWLKFLVARPPTAADPLAVFTSRDWADLPPYHPCERL